MTTTVGRLTHDDVLSILLIAGVLLAAARVMGMICSRLGQPSVIGEISAGIILGPSFLSALFPSLGHFIIPQTTGQGHALETITLLGAMFLLLITGMEIDLGLIRRHARSAIGVALGGLLVPLVCGYSLATILPPSMHGKVGDQLVFSLFLATAMSISAIPVLAKVLFELGLFRRNLGQTILAAAMIDDATGWILLSIVLALAQGHEVTVIGVTKSIFTVLGLVFVSLTVGRAMLKTAFRLTERQTDVESIQTSLVVVCMFTWAAFSQWLELEALFGAFIVGAVLSLVPSLLPRVVHTLEQVALQILAPLFFASAGLKVHIQDLMSLEVAGAATLILLTATGCKLCGVYLGARYLAKLPHWTAVFYGAGLNARGSMEIVLATIGLSFGIISVSMFTAIVVMALLTSLIAPPMMMYAEARIPKDQSEEERLQREEREKASLVAQARRVLVPTRYRETGMPAEQHLIAAYLLNRLGSGKEVSITLMCITEKENEGRANEYLEAVASLMPDLRTTRLVVTSDTPGDSILDEARKGYDFLLMGTPEQTGKPAEIIFTPLIDYVLRLSPCPVLLVRGPSKPIDLHLRRVLVPTNGSHEAAIAAEFGLSLLGKDATDFLVLKVVEIDKSSGQQSHVERQIEYSHEMIDQLVSDGRSRGVDARGRVIRGSDPSVEVMKVIQNDSIDVLVLGTNVRAGSSRLYLGPRVERLLRDAPCAVLLVNS